MNAVEKPRIGITTYVETASWGSWERKAALLPTSYVTAIQRGGGVPILIPPTPGCASVALSGVNALVIAGGADVDPVQYGEKPHRTVIETRPDRDEWEIELAHLALRQDIPLLGVCRGAQILNVALGGTLRQHLPEVVEHDDHRPRPATFGRSKVTLEPGSAAGKALGSPVEVSCYHHQAIDQVGSPLAVVGRATDGTVEAIELPGHRFAVGVQWHPEEDLSGTRLFQALATAAFPRAVPQPVGGSR